MKSKIALITKGFTGSLFPLAKQFLLKGYEVDIYLFYYIEFSELEAFKCKYKSEIYGLEQIHTEKWKEMHEYLGDTDSVRLFSLKMPRPYFQIPILRNVVSLYSSLFVHKVTSFINQQDYKVINFIGGYYSQEYLPFLKRIDTKVVFSLHEVCDHFNPDFDNPSPLLKYLFKNSIDLIIYSDNSLRDILKYKDVNKEKLHRLNFGLFETFKTIAEENQLNLPSKYFLYFGSILPYKGLPVLNEAIKMMPQDWKGYKLVVAGKGSDPSLEDMAANPNVLLINKRLSNAELCEVIKHSAFVVCPYYTMSQSGIPQTVYAFGKPIIASDLPGFKEVIEPGENGALFHSGKSNDLAKYISKFIDEEETLAKCSANVSMFEDKYPFYSWPKIADLFITKFID